MQNGSQHDIAHRSQPDTAAATGGGRSTIEPLPPAIREAVAAAVTGGWTIDAIAALIRARRGSRRRPPPSCGAPSWGEDDA